MAYEEYRGRNIGRLMCFLYRMTHHSDRWIFGQKQVIFEDQSEKNILASYKWIDGTDVPVLKFVSAPRYSSDPKIWLRHMNGEQQARATKEVLNDEAEMLSCLNELYEEQNPKPYFQLSQNLYEGYPIGWKMDEIKSDGTKKKTTFIQSDEMIRGSNDGNLSTRLKLFSRYPSKMAIKDHKGKTLLTVEDCMKWRPIQFNLEV